MQTFDMSLYQLYTRERITLEEALANADSRNDLALRIRLEGAGGRGAAPPMNYQPHPALEPLDVALYRPEPKPAQ